MLWNLKKQSQKKFGSQSDAARVLQVNESILSKVIRERKQLSGQEQKRWASIFECTAEELFAQD